MPAEETYEEAPAGFEVSYIPRQPEFDATLGIPVDVDRTGTPRNRLVTIGDSLTHGFMSGAIFRTDLSWPAIVAYELGIFPMAGRQSLMPDAFRFPGYEPPGGPGGLPLDIERALRAFESRFGAELNWHEFFSAAAWLYRYLDGIEDYWERGPGKDPPGKGPILHNLAIYGWDLRDTLSLTATELHRRIKKADDDVWYSKQKVENDNDRAALVILETARDSKKKALTPLQAAQVLGDEGTDAADAGPGIETLVVILGSNNALQSVTKLQVAWTKDDDYADIAKKSAYTVWQPQHFDAEWALLVEELRAVRARHVIVATVPAVTIAPIAKGVGGKVRRGSRFFRYYTRPWIPENEFEPRYDKRLTAMQARAVDTAIDAYNKTIVESVRAARNDGLDWYLFDLAGLLDRLAVRRYITDPAARPDWWTPYELPPELAALQPVPNTRFFLSGPNGRTDGGLFSLDGIHPTTIAYGLIAHEIIKIMDSAGVKFRTPTDEVRNPPVGVDFARILAADTLISKPPSSLAGHLATLGWLDDKLDWVTKMYR